MFTHDQADAVLCAIKVYRRYQDNILQDLITRLQPASEIRKVQLRLQLLDEAAELLREESEWKTIHVTAAGTTGA